MLANHRMRGMLSTGEANLVCECTAPLNQPNFTTGVGPEQQQHEANPQRPGAEKGQRVR
jgi:hypothetical protein